MLDSKKIRAFVCGLLAIGIVSPACSVDMDDASEDPSREGNLRQPATGAAVWTGWISEEFGGPAQCPPNMTVIGVDCSGSYCDQVRLRCDTFPTTLSGSRWTHWVEHGGDIFGNGALKEAVCGENEWMTGIDCMGDYCDNVRIECKSGNRQPSNCAWTPTAYSEEQGAFTVPSNRYIRGVRCEGTHCDNKNYYVCESRPASGDSCQGRCGSVSSGGTCWCDDLCTGYGDCCADRAAYCG